MYVYIMIYAFPQVDGTVMIKNQIKKTDDGMYLVVTKASRVAFWAPLDSNVHISDSLREAARLLLAPPPAEKVSLKEALEIPRKKKVSIVGRIVQVSFFPQF